MLKRVAAIHDISGVGKCSLTVALPILSACSVEVAAMPTAVLSTHTGEISGYTYRDLTDDLVPMSDHWKNFGIEFDGIYSGFLGSSEQVDIVCDFIDKFKKPETTIIVDPAMADHGRMYTTFKKDFSEKMKTLCKKADIIVPNITEAAFLTGEEYIASGYGRDYIELLLKKLLMFGVKTVILTGISFEKGSIGCAVMSANDSSAYYCFSKEYEGVYYGTGDIFASVITGAYIRGADIKSCVRIALGFTSDSIRRTYEAGTDTRLGVDFEHGISKLIKELEEVL